MYTFTLAQGKRYRATLTLSWLESFAGNDMVAGEFAKAGFTDVVVQGSGESRTAEGVWSGETMMVSLPGQVTDVVEVA